MSTPSWNEAFAALEADFGTLLAVTRSYDDFTKQVATQAGKRVRAAVQRFHEITVDTDDESIPGQWGLTVELGGDLTDVGLDVRTWFAVAYGGPPGKMRAVLYLSQEPAAGMPELEVLVREARSTLSFDTAVLGEPDVVETDDPPLAVRTLEISAPAPEVALADAVTELVTLGERVGEALLDLRELTPYALLLRVLRQVVADGVLERTAGTSVKAQTWAGGKDLVLYTKDTPQSWITAFPTGELTLHWGQKRNQNGQTRQRVLEATGGSPDDRMGYLGVRLLSVADVQRAIDSDEPEDARAALSDHLVKAWQTWRAVVQAAEAQ